MFIIFVIFFATVFANTYEKYIDLLPEEDKEEFLDHVARRVYENAEKEKNTTNQKFSMELTDEQLKKHQDFVQTVFEEEANNLRRKKGGTVTMEEDKKPEEKLKVKPLSTTADIVEDSSTNDNKKQSYNDTEPVPTENTNSNVTLQKRSIKNDDESAETATKSHQESKTEVNEVVASTKFTDLTAEKAAASTEDESTDGPTTVGLDETVALAIKRPNGKFRRLLHTSDEITTQFDKELTEREVTTTTEAIDSQSSTTEPKSLEDSTEKPIENTEKSEENTTTTDIDNLTSTTTSTTEKVQETTTKLKPKESDVETTTTVVEISGIKTTTPTTLTEKTTTEVVADLITVEPTTEIPKSTVTTPKGTTIYSSETNITAVNTTETNTTEENTTETNTTEENTTETNTTEANMEINVATISSNHNRTTTEPAIIINATNKTDTSNLESTTNIPLLGITPMVEITTKKPKKSKSKLNKKDNSTVSSVVKKKKSKKKKKKINKSEEEKDFALIQKQTYQATLEKGEACGLHTCRYRVYEVQWPVSAENQSPFLRSKEPVVDQPYFVPIYNYSPNLAYFNPQNRRGPNAVEENSVDIETLRAGNGLLNDNDATPELELNFKGIRSRFGHYKKKDSNDKIRDMLKKADDNNAVMKGLKILDDDILPTGNLKDEIRSIRNVLFHNKRNKRKKKHIDYDPLKLYNLANRDISMDYFYGRSQPESINTDIFKDLMENHDVKIISLGPSNPHFRNKKRKVKKSKPNKKNKETNKPLDDSKDKTNNIKKKEVKSEVVTHSNEVKFNSYMNALKELIISDNNALQQYDWLSSTVQIHAALSKLMELVDRVKNSETVHPADLQILKYTVFLFNFATEIKHAYHYGSKFRNKLMLPRNKRRKERFRAMNDKDLLNRVWLYIRTLMPDLTDLDGLQDFYQFLMDVEDGLFDLHEAVRNIATITKFKNQNWYRNLKDLYLTTEEKQLREVLLHISLARLVDLVEFSCRNGVEDDFVKFMKTHKATAKRTLEELMFVLKIIEEINNHTP